MHKLWWQHDKITLNDESLLRILQFTGETTSKSAFDWHAGVTGNILINNRADRLNSFDIWDYAEGQDFYRRSMLVDLSQPPDKVSDSHTTQHWDLLLKWYHLSCFYFLLVAVDVDNVYTSVFRLDALALSVIATATWLAGWLAGCHTPVLYQNR